MPDGLYSGHHPIVLAKEEFGAYPPPPIPEALSTLLFGHGFGSCFVLIDAARITHLPEILASTGLSHDCLFQGDAAAELGEVAPWLVQLTQDSRFTRRLLTGQGSKWGMWEHDAAVFLRSAADLGELRRHFRRMTRLHDPATDRWFYYRFYAAPTQRGLVAGMPKDKLLRFMGPVTRFIVPDGDARMLVIERPETGEPDATL